MIYRKVKLLDGVRAAYIAGLIDGEGTVTLSRGNRNKHPGLIVEISNSDLKLLQWVKGTVGVGDIRSKKPISKKHAVGYTFRIRNRQALNLLGQLSSYLKTYKRERAKIVLKDYIKLTPRNGKYTLRGLLRRQKLVKVFLSIISNKDKGKVFAI